MLARRCRIAVAQLNSTADYATNLAACASHVQKAAEGGASLVCFPENFALMPVRPEDALAQAEPLDGPRVRDFRRLCQQHRVWLSLGGFQESAAGGAAGPRYHNTHLVLDDQGELRASYRKIHLFDADVGARRYRESERVAPGEQVVAVDSPCGRLGLSVCYDLRFPGLYGALRYEHGASVMLVPSAFTVPTGEAHWSVLLRSLAITTQCYVVAAAQVGVHNAARSSECGVPPRASYGHAMVVSPFGTVLAEADGELPGLLFADLDPPAPEHPFRRDVPVEEHRRPRYYKF